MYLELISKYSWDESIALVSEILSKNNDTSHLFALITQWMTEQNSEQKLNLAFPKWLFYFSNEDKKLLEIFCQQYGFNIEPNSYLLNDTFLNHVSIGDALEKIW